MQATVFTLQSPTTRKISPSFFKTLTPRSLFWAISRRVSIDALNTICGNRHRLKDSSPFNQELSRPKSSGSGHRSINDRTPQLIAQVLFCATSCSSHCLNSEKYEMRSGHAAEAVAARAKRKTSAVAGFFIVPKLLTVVPDRPRDGCRRNAAGVSVCRSARRSRRRKLA